tara:strand:- start:27146 stop:28444 length:1299 start_codon:yes stop_codon:yes gene_type:complete
MNFSKVLLVLQREYLTRVRTKSFILSTILTPLVIIGFMAVMVYITVTDTEVEKKVGIVDETGVLFERLVEQNEARYIDVSDIYADSLRKEVLNGKLDGYITLSNAVIDSNTSPTLLYGGSGGISFIESIRSDIRSVVREERLARANVSDDIRKIFEQRPSLEAKKLTEEGEEQDNAVFGTILGIILGIMIFVGLFGYGAVLMRSVIEEKTNRIVEVIASSVKPIELMIGKLFGVCLLALTQFGLWIAVYAGLSVAAAPVATMFMNQQQANLPPEAAEIAANNFDPSQLEQFVIDPMVFVYFFIFFVLGFLIYSAVFAAIGAAVDSEQDTQQFMMPVMLPIFAGYMLNFKIAENPDSSLALFASLFPLTSPINMMTRIVSSNVPVWEVLLSIALMAGTFAGLMWMAAKIYRVGILMYGKKPSYKELVKWIRQS